MKMIENRTSFHYHCVVFDVLLSFGDWSDDTSRQNVTFRSFTKKPNGFVRELDDDGHSFAGGIEFQDMQSMITPSLTVDFNRAYFVHFPAINDPKSVKCLAYKLYMRINCLKPFFNK